MIDLKLIKNFRKVKGYRQGDLARRVGVTQSYISMIEKGFKPNPPIRTIENILKELDCELKIQIL